MSVPIHLISIDPGDKHVGVAFFHRDGYGVWECVDAQEFEPEEFILAFMELVLDVTEPLEWIVFERFRLYEDKSAEQRGSEFPTAQLIGQIKLVHLIHSQHMDKHDEINAEKSNRLLPCEAPGQRHNIREPHRVQIAGYMADIKKPTTGILRHKGIKSTASQLKAGGHCKDAELHGYYHILKTLKEEAR